MQGQVECHSTGTVVSAAAETIIFESDVKADRVGKAPLVHTPVQATATALLSCRAWQEKWPGAWHGHAAQRLTSSGAHTWDRFMLNRMTRRRRALLPLCSSGPSLSGCISSRSRRRSGKACARCAGWRAVGRTRRARAHCRSLPPFRRLLVLHVPADGRGPPATTGAS